MSYLSAMQNKASSWGIARRIVAMCLIFVFVLGLSLAVPKPARANDQDGDAGIIAQLVQNIKNGLQQIQWLKDTFDLLSKLNSFLNTILGKINDSVVAVGQELSAGQEATLRAEMDAMQQLSDNASKDAMTASGAAAVVRGTPPPAKSDAWHHCASIYENAKPMAMEDFVNKVAAAISKGVNLRYRGAGVDGLGGQYDYQERQTRLGKNTQNEANTYNPVDGNTSGSGVEGANGVAEYDIDVARWDSTPLIIPQMKTDGTYVVAVPSGSGQELLEQQRWVAARNFCYEIAGRRPTPPYGKQLDTPEGMRRMANWSHCAAIQSAFTLQCGYYVARFSRPNKTDAPALWKATQSLCEIVGAEAYGGVDKMPTVFDKCAYGTSQYEAEYLTLALCASPKHSIAAAGAGANYPEIMTTNDMCALRITTWQTHNAAERTNLLIALSGILDIDKCWAGSEGTPVRMKSSSADDRGDTVQQAQKARVKRVFPEANDNAKDAGFLPISVAN